MSEDSNAREEERIQRLLQEYEVLIRKSVHKQPRTLHQIEVEVEEIGKQIKETLTREIIQESAPLYAGTRLDCACRGRARFKGWRSRKIITLHGHIRFERAYFYCASCRNGFAPADQQLDIGTLDCSRSVQALSARVSNYLSFGKAAGELNALCGITLSASSVQSFAKSVGQSLGEEWNRLQTDLSQKSTQNLSQKSTRDFSFANPRYFISMDAFKAHVGGEWRDAKLGVVYRRTPQDMIAGRMFYASFERSKDFGPRMLVLARRFGVGLGDDLQMVADGAEWIWIETGKQFPKCVETLDYYHHTEKLLPIAKARFGEGTPDCARWVQAQKERLLHGECRSVIKGIQDWHPVNKTKQELRRTTLCYMQTHQARTDYEALRANGYEIGSGIMEAGCKTMKTRIGGPGMRWEQPGAEKMLHLNAYWNSNQANNFISYTQN